MDRAAEIEAVMLVGEQPGDKVDVEGAPFVGPAAFEGFVADLRAVVGALDAA